MFAHIFKTKIALSEDLKQQIIDDVVKRLAIGNPLKAIVFGSFADGSAHVDSDIDVLVICRDGQDLQNVRRAIYSGLEGPITQIPVDFIFVTLDTFITKRNLGGICMTANDSGLIIFESGSTL